MTTSGLGQTYGPECTEKGNHHIVKSPHAFANDCFTRFLGRKLKIGETHIQELDIDRDETTELFIGRSGGNAGNYYYGFKKEGDYYWYMGALIFHPKAIRVVTPDHDGLPKLLLYKRYDATSGLLMTVKYRDMKFETVFSEMIYPKDNETDGRKYDTLFNQE